MSHASACAVPPINLAEHRARRRARAGRPAPAMHFARRRLTHDEFTESQQARLRAAEDLAFRSPFRPVFAWALGLVLSIGLYSLLLNH